MNSGLAALQCYWGNRQNAVALAVLAIAAVAAIFSLPPIADPPSYFDFADRRTLLGVAHLMNVISNAPWAIIGLAGLVFTLRIRTGSDGPFSQPWERTGSLVLFASMLGISFGSAWFHSVPGPSSLLWDRLPMAAVFMSFFTLVIGDRIGLHAGRLLFWPLVAFGLFSVLYWQHTHGLGRGDLRFYVLAQFFPMLAIPLMLVFCHARYTRASDIWLCLACYVLSKLFELWDAPVFALTGVLSGHTLKHLAGAFAALFILRNIQLRRTIRFTR